MFICKSILTDLQTYNRTIAIKWTPRKHVFAFISLPTVETTLNDVNTLAVKAKAILGLDSICFCLHLFNFIKLNGFTDVITSIFDPSNLVGVRELIII